MPANTSHGLPYPLPTEPVAEGAQAIRNLAEALDLVPKRLAVISLAAPAATLDFQNIPQTFEHLRLVIHARGDLAATDAGQRIRINNNATAAYDWQMIQGAVAAVTAAANTGDTFIPAGEAAGNTDAAAAFSLTEVLFSRYATTGRILAVLAQSSHATNLRKLTQQIAATYRGYEAVTRITCLLSAGNYVAGTHATLYGLP